MGRYAKLVITEPHLCGLCGGHIAGEARRNIEEDP